MGIINRRRKNSHDLNKYTHKRATKYTKKKKKPKWINKELKGKYHVINLNFSPSNDYLNTLIFNYKQMSRFLLLFSLFILSALSFSSLPFGFVTTCFFITQLYVVCWPLHLHDFWSWVAPWRILKQKPILENVLSMLSGQENQMIAQHLKAISGLIAHLLYNLYNSLIQIYVVQYYYCCIILLTYDLTEELSTRIQNEVYKKKTQFLSSFFLFWHDISVLLNLFDHLFKRSKNKQLFLSIR